MNEFKFIFEKVINVDDFIDKVKKILLDNEKKNIGIGRRKIHK